MFNAPPVSGDAFTSAVSGLTSQQVHSAGMGQATESSSHQAGLASISAGTGQGRGYEWNEMLQRMGGGGPSDNASSSIRHLEQQLLQGGGGRGVSVATGPATVVGQSFRLNGLLGPGGGQ